MRRLLGAAFVVAAATGVHAAGGAFVVDDAAIGAPGDCQVESWVSAAGNGDLGVTSQPACVGRFGALTVEVTAAFAAARSDDAWAGHAGVQAKTVLLPMGSPGIAVALTAGTLVDLTNGVSATLVNLPVTIKLHEQLSLNLNAGALWLEDAHFAWGAGLEWELRQPWTLLVEVFGHSGPESETRFQAGLRYAPAKSVDIDLIWGHNLAGENAQWITVGVAKRF